MKINARKFWKILKIFKRWINIFGKVFTSQNWNFGVWQTSSARSWVGSLRHRKFWCPIGAMHRKIRWCHISCQKVQRLLFRRSVTGRSHAPSEWCIGRSDGATSVVRRFNGYYSGAVWPEVPTPPIGSSDAYAEKGTTATQCLVRVGGLYKRLTPAIFKLLEFRDATPTLEKFSKTTKELLDQIFMFNTSCESVSARLALEWVSEWMSKVLCLVLWF